jgi:hypothetical protein
MIVELRVGDRAVIWRGDLWLLIELILLRGNPKPDADLKLLVDGKEVPRPQEFELP